MPTVGAMRLKRTLNRRVGNQAYYKWLLADLPPAIVESLGWSETDDLEAVAERGVLTVRRARKGK
jgi:hypothetical protein